MGVLAQIPLGPFNVVVLPIMAKGFKINPHEAEFEFENYKSCDAYFTRRLKAGVRPISKGWVHPADSMLTQSGKIEKGHILQAKSWDYSAAEFLGEDILARTYEGGYFMTYYLCPADYHRVHSPLDGELISARHIPGVLWPVNDWSVNNVKRLFCLNERVVLNFRSQEQRWSLVMVGATNVGKISIPQDPSIITNRWMWHAPTDRKYEPPIEVKAGEEVGVFHLGSTVICLYEKGLPSPVGVQKVKMGEPVC